MTWDATDACGNHSATRTQTITVVDTQPPTIGQAGGNGTIECTATPSFTVPTASDACNGATVNCLGTTTTTTGCTKVITRTWDATDACGNHSATRAQVITVVDTTPPTIGQAGGNTTIECTATPSFTAPTASDACNGATVNCLGTTTSTTGCTKVVTRTWDATDACGNHSATRTQIITVVDTQPPTIGSAGANATVCSTCTPPFAPPTALDACNGATVNLISDFTTAAACPNKWTETRIWDATDACGNHSATRTQIITFANVAPTVSSAPSSQSKTYGAAIDPVTVTANDPDSPGSTLTAAGTSYAKTGGGTSPGLMPGLSIATTATSTNSRTWTVTGCALADVGTYTQTITVTDDCGATTTTSFTIIITSGYVNPVGDGYYTGPSFYWTTGPSSSTTTLTLSATVKNALVNCGDIRTAKVSFFIDNGGGSFTPINGAQNLPVGLVNPGDLSTGTASAIVQYNVGSSTVTQLLIAVRITGNYTGSLDPADESLVTIAIPTPGGLIVGGGKLCNETSAGYIKGAPSPEKTCFSFSVQYNKSLTNVQGGVYLYVKSYNDRNGNTTSTLHTYKLKSTSISGLVISGQRASFGSKANITEIVNGVEQSIEGNCVMQLDVYDKDVPPFGTADSLGVVVYRKAGGVWFSNNWVVTKTVEAALCGGDLSVSGTGTSSTITTTSPMARQSAREIVVFNQLNLKAYPNPSENVFTLQVESDNLKDKISLRIFDMAGRTIQTFTNLAPGQTLKVGSNYKVGVYFIDMMQGDKHKQVKLVKQ
jgi:hypothetical protein